ncbi:multiheme c-type cytochrome [Geobacter anodireducens]|uniref:multiheme c-type cytochrome n=1 Tax=Geobacter soli TaxID=1510391 RepID=UPI00068ED2FB|nr:multiheme c-type cytochrome [Geobacter soli]
MSRKATRYSAVLAASLFAAALAGCGSENKEGSIGTGPGGVATVGDTACVQCHSAVTEALTGESIITQYQKSSPHNRADLGCESCHGGGAQHNGVGPIPFAHPDANRCADCHDGTTAVATNSNTAFAGSRHNTQSVRDSANCKRCHSHEGAILSNIYGLTGDNATITNVDYINRVPLASNYTQISCATCHEHGGGLRTIKAIDGSGNLVNWDPNNNRRIDQFDLCTSCHTLYNYNGTQLLAGGNPLNGVATGVSLHAATSTRWYGVLATTHFDNYSTGPQAGAGASGTNTKIEGYVLRRTGANPCFDCHGHESKTNTRNEASRGPTIHTDWAQSGHGGGLLTAKYAAVAGKSGTAAVTAALNAYVDDATAVAWTHYNWDASSRGSCQRCHTATGAANFMSNPATYKADGSGNNFSHLQGWNATNGSKQNELLYCWGCHTNAGTGELRNPGAITETYSPGTPGDPATVVAYPNIGKSNTCMTCHLGREVGDVIKNDQDADGVRGFINSHYLAAGGTVFGKTGYTFGNRDYDSTPKGFVHDKLGVSATGNAAADAYIAQNGLSTSGPCAACHLGSEKLGAKTSHTYSPFSEYAAGDVALNPLCVTCHTSRGAGSNAKSAWFEATWKTRSDAALEALRAQLDNRGMYFFNAHPYFYQGAGGSGGAFTNWAGVFGFAEWKDAMGTAFNYNLLAHDPGAVAHNRYYVRRLVYDSIDKLDDGILNYSVSATLNALDGAVATYKNDAIAFLINSAGTAGTASERY